MPEFGEMTDQELAEHGSAWLAEVHTRVDALQNVQLTRRLNHAHAALQFVADRAIEDDVIQPFEGTGKPPPENP